jgi:hypothetical protein
VYACLERRGGAGETPSACAERCDKKPSPRQSLRSGARVSEGPGLAGSGNASVQIMSIKFNDTQLVLLRGAAQRDDHCLAPPTGPKRAQAQRAIVKLLEAGIVKEIRAKAGAPIWRRDEEKGHTYALKLTAAGVKAIAVDETPPFQGEAERRPDHLTVSVDPKPESNSDPAAGIDRPDNDVASTLKSPRRGTRSRRSSNCCRVTMA